MKSAETKPATIAKSGPGKPFFTGSGEAMQEQDRRPAFFSYGKKGVQAKLRIGKVGDSFEREADATADRVVMRLAEPRRPSKDDRGGLAHDTRSAVPPVQAKCAACEEKERKEKEKESPEHEKIRKKPIFDSNAEPPPGTPPDEVRRCAACDKEATVPTHIESRLNSSKGGGSPLPKGTREKMEGSMGADFSGVRIHTGSNAAGMSSDLHAHAFTHGGDIYFNSGKYNPENKEGQHLLAHELTHTVQQGAAVRRKPETAGIQEPAVKERMDPAAPKVQRLSWDDVTDFGSSVVSGIGDAAGWAYDKASDAAGYIADKASEIAGDIKDAISSAAHWVKGKFDDLVDLVEEGLAKVVDFLRDMINEVQEKIEEAFKSVKDFIADKLNFVKDAGKAVLKLFLSPLTTIADALENLDGDTIEAGWKGFVSFVQFSWHIFRDSVEGVLDAVQGLWKGIAGFVDGVFDAIDSVVNSRAFGLLPGFIQRGAQSIVDGFRGFWNKIKGEFDGVFDTISSAVAFFFREGDEFLEKLSEIPIAKIVGVLNKVGTLIKRFLEILHNPMLLIDPVIKWMEEKLKAAPDQFLAEINKHIEANKAKKKAANKGKVPKRYTLNNEDIALGVVRACIQKWKQIEIGKMLKDMLLSMAWPPATFNAIGEAWHTMVSDIGEVISGLYRPESLHDLWTNLMHLGVIIDIIWRFINTVLGLLYVYIALILILGGGILGAIFGAGAGAVPGMLAGAEVAADLGELMLLSFLAGETTSVIRQYLILATALNTEEQQEKSFNTIADSIIGLVTAGILAILSAIASRIAQGLMSAARGIFSKLTSLLGDAAEDVKGAAGEPHAAGTEGKAGGPGDEGGRGGADDKGPVDDKGPADKGRKGPEDKGAGDKGPADKGEGDAASDKAAGDDQGEIDPKVEEGEAPLEKPLMDTEDGQGKLAMDKDGECEVCRSPCWKLRKKYGNRITRAIEKRIRDIELKRISNRAKLKQMRPIEKELKAKLTHLTDEGKLRPNQNFEMAGEHPGYFGESDALGRLKRVHTDDLKLSEYDRVSHRKSTPGKRGSDQAGHLIGDRFGGSRGYDNLVSQTTENNLSVFKKLENDWAEALEKGQKVEVDIDVNYNGSGKRPASFDVKYKINGKSYKMHLPN